MGKLEELRARLSELRAEKNKLRSELMKEEKLLRESVKPIHSFTLEPSKQQFNERMFDDTLKWYTLYGEVTNKYELIDAGWSESEAVGGFMRYLYNSTTRTIATRSGGGTIFIPEESSYLELAVSESDLLAETRRVYKELGEFIHANPEGGDLTAIVKGHKCYRW
jgi:DNA repair exonuclease SbcCD ATPase subunit